MPKLKAIGFDQGGILVDVDYNKTIAALYALGEKNVEQIFSQAEQADTVDQLERGLITPAQFRGYLRDVLQLSPEITDRKLDAAWGALLLDFKRESFDVVCELKEAGS